MKRSFIRALWGDVSNHRNGKIAKEITSLKERDWFTVYVFGTENHDWLKSLGYNVILINEDPVVWDLEEKMYRHKLEVFNWAFDDFDEFAFLDWDCVPVAKMDEAWNELGRKEVFQANLFQYRTKKCLWRAEDTRKVCNGGFAYFRDSSIPPKMINIYNKFVILSEKQKQFRESRGQELRFREKCLLYDDEPSMSKFVDDYCGVWPGSDYYWDNFEPSICNLRKKSVYSKDRLDSKNVMFIHNL